MIRRLTRRSDWCLRVHQVGLASLRLLKEAGKNPFSLDSKEPTESFRDFLLGQVRYAAVAKQFPDVAEELFNKAEQDAKERLDSYKRLANHELVH